MGERREGARRPASARADAAAGSLPTDPSRRPARRRGRGTLAGRLTLPDDWDSTETNEEIAEVFYR